MSTYLWINLLSISIPLLVSFHPRVKLYKKWSRLSIAILLALIPYIIWDVYFTEKGFWGFNEVYLIGVYILGLPVEEWLFFICIPYACIFTHYALLDLNSKRMLKAKSVKYVTMLLLLLFALNAVINYQLAYTLVDMLFAFFILLIAYLFNKTLLKSFYLTFLVMLIPFIIVNGVLTGTGIENEVVWYNDLENLGIRFLTIPVEDFAYAFSLILLNLLVFERLYKPRNIKTSQ